MPIFYTGKGDKGASFVGKKKIPKTAYEINALGALDELNSMIGVVKNKKLIENFGKILHQVQEDLFIIQSNVAAFMFENDYVPPKFEQQKVKWLEGLIDEYEQKVEPARKFVIPGATESSAWFDVIRAMARRAERKVAINSEKHPISPEVLAYMNRLSSLFFAMARMEAKSSGESEIHPQYS